MTLLLGAKYIVEQLQNKRGFVCDMDGVIYHGAKLLPGAKAFVDWLTANDKRFLFLTNNSKHTPLELQQKLDKLGISVGAEHFMTSAIATASFLASQCPKGKAYVIGDNGLYQALSEAGFSFDENNPVISDNHSYRSTTVKITGFN